MAEEKIEKNKYRDGLNDLKRFHLLAVLDYADAVKNDATKDKAAAIEALKKRLHNDYARFLSDALGILELQRLGGVIAPFGDSGERRG